MKCPYCNNEMSSGLLNGRGGGGFFWMSEGDSLSALSSLTEKNIEKKKVLYLIQQHMVGLSIQHKSVRIVKRFFLNFSN